MLIAEPLQKSVLSFARAAHVVVLHKLSDHHHHRDRGLNPGRIFKLPYAMFERLSGHIHRFFFLHDSGHDAAHGLLAFRSSLDFAW